MAKVTKDLGLLLILLIFGSVFGSLLGELLSEFLPFLNYGRQIGFAPVTVDLAAISFTVGVLLRLNLATIFGFFLAFFIYQRL